MGDTVGMGVGEPAMYVGDKVGTPEGAAEGLDVGLGVGEPGT